MVCIILVVSGLLLDWVLRSDLKKEDERFLATQMQSLRILLREYPDDVKTWKAEIERDTRASASTFAKYYVRITDEDGKTIIETPGMPIQYRTILLAEIGHSSLLIRYRLHGLYCPGWETLSFCFSASQGISQRGKGEHRSNCPRNVPRNSDR